MAIKIVDALDNSLKQLRIVQVLNLASIPLLVYAGEVLGPTKTQGLTMIGYFLLALAAYNIWSAFSWRQRKLRKASQFLLLHSNDGKAVKRWHSANLVLLLNIESFALFGCLLQAWGGGTLLQAVPFYTCALIFILVFTPRYPSGRIHAQAKDDIR
jgi:hypothetical protein